MKTINIYRVEHCLFTNGTHKYGVHEYPWEEYSLNPIGKPFIIDINPNISIIKSIRSGINGNPEYYLGLASISFNSLLEMVKNDNSLDMGLLVGGDYKRPKRVVSVPGEENLELRTFQFFIIQKQKQFKEKQL